MRNFYEFDICANDAEVISQINNCYLDTVTGNGIKYESCRISFSADAKRRFI